MTRSKKGRRSCPSCAPGCKCDWCMGSVERRAERQAPLPPQVCKRCNAVESECYCPHEDIGPGADAEFAMWAAARLEKPDAIGSEQDDEDTYRDRVDDE